MSILRIIKECWGRKDQVWRIINDKNEGVNCGTRSNLNSSFFFSKTYCFFFENSREKLMVVFYGTFTSRYVVSMEFFNPESVVFDGI